MLTNFKIALRNLYKRRAYTMLNLFGLIIGMSSCLLIFHYVAYERSYDKQTADDNIYRVHVDSYNKGRLEEKFSTIPPAVGPTLKRDFPEIENCCRLYEANILLSNPEKNINFFETKGYFAEPSFIDFFHTTFVAGNPHTALSQPNTIIISERLAKKFYGNEPAIGKRFPAKRLPPLEVTGVFKEHPANSHLKVDFLVSFITFDHFAKIYDSTLDVETRFNWFTFYTYLKLKPGTDLKKLTASFPAFCKKYMPADEPGSDGNVLSLMRADKIHLYSDRNFELDKMGNGRMVSFMFLIALFVIGIAWINYINLSTARSVERAKEVGVKKVLGASRATLIKYFFLENVLLNLCALIFSLFIFYGLLAQFDVFSGRANLTGISLTPNYWLLFFTIFCCGTFLSGIYPAIFLSAFEPVRVLKGAFKNTTQGIGLRKTLIVTQFSISIILFAGTIIVYKQVQFMRQKELGVNIDQTIVLTGPAYLQTKNYEDVYRSFKADLLSQAGIKMVTASSQVPGMEIYWTTGVKNIGANINEAPYLTDVIEADHDFVPMYGLKLLAGRGFSKDFPTDKKTILVNERTMSLLGFNKPKDIINKRIVSEGDTISVLGVLKNYHQEGLQKQIRPLIIRLTPEINSHYSIRTSSKHVTENIRVLNRLWQKHFHSCPFDYYFLDDRFDEQYKSDILFGKVFGIFAILAIIIAFCGLLGLTAYNVLQRAKEIGIRKVLGATTQSILALLSRDFMRLIFLAIVIAIPLGWYLMNRWLQDYAYRISISFWVFIIAGATAVMIALLTICLQTIKTATTNPVKSLRTE